MRKLILLLLSLFLAACSWLHPAAQKPVARTGLLLAPATLGASISVQQRLTVTRADHIDQLDTALEIDPQQLNFVGLALGQRVMTIHYDGKNLQIWQHPLLPKQVRGVDVLEDLELTLWPINTIRAALPTGWAIQEHDKQRTLLLNNRPIMIINYSGKKRWLGKIVINNLYYHYRLTILSSAIYAN
jgi:hypothetical protein